MNRVKWTMVDILFHGICGVLMTVGLNFLFQKTGYPYQVALEQTNIIVCMILGIPGSILLFACRIFLS